MALPIEPESKLVEIKPEVKKKVFEYWNSGKSKAPDWKALINGLLDDVINKETEFLPVYAPYLSKVAFEANTVFIRDAKKNQTAEITIKDSRLFCNIDSSEDCPHIHFALALPETARLRIRKQPKDETKRER